MPKVLRETIMRSLLLVTTVVAVMGYSFTQSYWFVPLPFVGGAILVALALAFRKYIPQDEQRLKRARRAIVQVSISCILVSGFLVYRLSTSEWQRAVGYGIMLSTLCLFLILAILDYRYVAKRCGKWKSLGGRRSRAFDQCEEIRSASRVYGEEETRAAGRATGGGEMRPVPSDDR